MIKQDDMIQDIEAEVHHEIIIITKTIILTQDIVQHLERDSVMTKILLLHNTHDHDITTINAIQDLTDHLTGHHVDLPIDLIIMHRSRSYSRDKNFQRYTSSFRPPSRPPRDPRSSRSRSHSHSRNEINTIQPQTQNDPINFEVRM